MDWPTNPLHFDPKVSKREIIEFLSNRFEFLNRKYAVVGLSGGLDSSLTAALAVESLGAENVKLYYLPERDSKSIHKKHALILSKKLGVKLNIIPITPALRALRIYSLLPLNYFPGQWLKSRAVEFGRSKFLENTQGEFLSIRLANSGGTWVARGNAYASAKHRIRSVVLYREAERLRGMVVGAANKTEWLTGTFTQWGCDHNADVMPIVHLYRTQLEILAEHLDLPDAILHKKADPDVLPGLTDKGSLLGSFEEADLILWGIENHLPDSEIQKRFSTKQVDYIQTLVRNSAYYRETPYSLLQNSAEQ
jgi:NAD+ synthase